MQMSHEIRKCEVGIPALFIIKGINIVYLIYKFISVTSLVVLFLSLLAGIVVRYMMSTNLGWPSEMPNLLFPWLTMGAIVCAAAKREHIGVSFVVDQLKTSLQKAIELSIYLLSGIVFFLLSLKGLDVVNIAGSQRFPVTGIAMSWAYWSVVSGFGGLAIVSLLNFLLCAIGKPLSSLVVSHPEEHAL